VLSRSELRDIERGLGVLEGGEVTPDFLAWLARERADLARREALLARLVAAEAILRELAALPEPLHARDAATVQCAGCGAQGALRALAAGRFDHADACLWIRARAWVAAKEGP
jgi:hypothetical protein